MLSLLFVSSERLEAPLQTAPLVPTVDGADVSRGVDEKLDQGVCLSMHQPWASLLVRGIKRFEGRQNICTFTKHHNRTDNPPFTPRSWVVLEAYG